MRDTKSYMLDRIRSHSHLDGPIKEDGFAHWGRNALNNVAFTDEALWVNIFKFHIPALQFARECHQ
tara:strand:- start:5 stop:202 length:198 start_codon:yes stop_codon:yes gene_type:complete